MKTMKYLMAGALMVISSSAMAQVSLDDAIKAIKSNQDKKTVESIVKDAAKPYKKDAVALAKIGRAFLDVKDTLNTRKYAMMSVDAEKKLKEGKSGAGYIVLGDLEVFNDNPGDAASWYQNAIYFNPKNAEAYKKYAFIYRGRDPKQAAETLEQLRTVDPSYPVDAEKGHIYYMSATKNASYMPLALESYQKVQLPAMAKLESYYMTEYALVAFASQKFDKSKEIAEYGLQSKPRNAGYNRLAMYNSVELKQYDDAVKYVDRLFNQSDSLTATANDYKYAGLAYAGAGNAEKSLEMYEKQYEVSEGDAKVAVLKSLSDAYKAKDDYDKAIEKYKQYLVEKKETTANDYAALANLYRQATKVKDQAGQIDCINKAVDVYKEMIQKFPQSADYSNFMAARTIQTLDPDQKKGLAVPYYEALYNSIDAAGIKDEKTDKPRISEACQYLGIYAFKFKNDNATAKKYMEKLQSIDPDNALAKQILDAIK